MTRKPRVLGIVAGVAIGIVVFVVGFYINLVTNLCIDFTGGDGHECAEEERALIFWFWAAVVPIALVAGIGSGVGLSRLLRKREARTRPD